MLKLNKIISEFPYKELCIDRLNTKIVFYNKDDNKIEIRSLFDFQMISIIKLLVNIEFVSFSYDCKYIIVVTADVLHCYNIRTTIKELAICAPRINQAFILKNGKILVIKYNPKTVAILNRYNQEEYTFNFDDFKLVDNFQFLLFFEGLLTIFDENGKLIKCKLIKNENPTFNLFNEKIFIYENKIIKNDEVMIDVPQFLNEFSFNFFLSHKNIYFLFKNKILTKQRFSKPIKNGKSIKEDENICFEQFNFIEEIIRREQTPNLPFSMLEYDKYGFFKGNLIILYNKMLITFYEI